MSITCPKKYGATDQARDDRTRHMVPTNMSPYSCRGGGGGKGKLGSREKVKPPYNSAFTKTASDTHTHTG